MSDYQKRRKDRTNKLRAAGAKERKAFRDKPTKRVTVKKGRVTKGHNFNVQSKSGMRSVDKLIPHPTKDNSITAAPTKLNVTNARYDLEGKHIPTDPLTNPTAPTVANAAKLSSPLLPVANESVSLASDGFSPQNILEPATKKESRAMTGIGQLAGNIRGGLKQGFFGGAQDESSRDIQTKGPAEQISFAVGLVASIGLGEGLLKSMGLTKDAFRATSSANKLKLLKDWQVKATTNVRIGSADELAELGLREVEEAVTVLEKHVEEMKQVFRNSKKALYESAPEAEKVMFKVTQFIEKNVGTIGNAGDEALQAAQVGRITSNSKTKRGVNNIVLRVLRHYKKPIILAGAFTGAIMSYAWDGHLKVDTIIPGYTIAARDARQAGDLEGAALASAALDEFLDFTVLDHIFSAIPGVNVAKTTCIDGVKQGKISAQVINMLLVSDMEGGTLSEQIERGRVEKEDSEKRQVDYYNEQARINKDLLHQSDMLHQKEVSEFHRLNSMLIRHSQKKAAEELADLWLEFAKEKAIIDSSAYMPRTIDEYEPPSNLGFGLL